MWKIQVPRNTPLRTLAAFVVSSKTKMECRTENDGFDVFLTTDKNIGYQQDLTRRKIAVVVLGPQLRPHVQRIVEAVNAAALGSYVEVDIRPRDS
jgi:hypothetical protein